MREMEVPGGANWLEDLAHPTHPGGLVKRAVCVAHDEMRRGKGVTGIVGGSEQDTRYKRVVGVSPLRKNLKKAACMRFLFTSLIKSIQADQDFTMVHSDYGEGRAG